MPTIILKGDLTFPIEHIETIRMFHVEIVLFNGTTEHFECQPLLVKLDRGFISLDALNVRVPNHSKVKIGVAFEYHNGYKTDFTYCSCFFKEDDLSAPANVLLN